MDTSPYSIQRNHTSLPCTVVLQSAPNLIHPMGPSGLRERREPLDIRKVIRGITMGENDG